MGSWVRTVAGRGFQGAEALERGKSGPGISGSQEWWGTWQWKRRVMQRVANLCPPTLKGAYAALNSTSPPQDPVLHSN